MSIANFVGAIRDSVASGNWYSALALALTMPDICGRIDTPGAASQARYVPWFNRYIKPRYEFATGASLVNHTFLSGEDCYALRCAYLHQGEFDLAGQRARQALEKFVFVEPPGGGSVMHCNQRGKLLQLQVDIFCEHVCLGVDTWLHDIAANADKADAAENLGRIISFAPNVPLSLTDATDGTMNLDALMREVEIHIYGLPQAVWEDALRLLRSVRLDGRMAGLAKLAELAELFLLSDDPRYRQMKTVIERWIHENA
jgi:hypothetical protein